jgi:ABC-type branched-subunit amino acid transport system ATPase component
MTTTADARSFLVKLKVCNLGCIGPEGLEVSLDEIVCLVGANNNGKSTVLHAYEAAVTGAHLSPEEISNKSNGQPATVELWVHIPAGAENIDAKWKESKDGMLLVRSKWTWPEIGGKPVRTTWDPQANDYAEDGKAAGLDTVFNSRLPRPFRIGSLDDPTDEHKKLLELVLEPIKMRLANLMKEDGSPLRDTIKALQAEAEKPVTAFKDDLDKVQNRVNTSYRRVFSTAEIRLSVSLGELAIDPGTALVKSSHIGVVESHGQTRWSQQGTGSQRALFWSMLEVRSELNRIAEERRQMEKDAKDNEKELKKLKEKLPTLKKPDAINNCNAAIKTLEDSIAALLPGGTSVATAAPAPFLPGYMLLIDEPETALHPAAIRAAKEHLYSLAAESGWQVMLSTHHPAFIDPLKDHTTIVRLHRPEANAAPNVYRTDSVAFTGEEKAVLKTLLAFDQSVAEMFFSHKVIIVEGDTEFAAFTVAMDADQQAFPLDGRPLILRARGKWTIPLLVKMLAHFKVSCAVLHDVDAPKIGPSGNKNGAYSANGEITKAINAARDAGVPMIHRCSEPDFERKHGMNLPMKDKPFSAWKATKDDATIRASVRKVLDELCAAPDANAANHNDDGRHFEVKCKAWAKTNDATNPAFVFD